MIGERKWKKRRNTKQKRKWKRLEKICTWNWKASFKMIKKITEKNINIRNGKNSGIYWWQLHGKPVRLFLPNFATSNPCWICFTNSEMFRWVNREKVKHIIFLNLGMTWGIKDGILYDLLWEKYQLLSSICRSDKMHLRVTCRASSLYILSLGKS